MTFTLTFGWWVIPALLPSLVLGWLAFNDDDVGMRLAFSFAAFVLGALALLTRYLP